MNLPQRIHWPDSAVTFLLIGGQDNFRGNFSEEEYVAETRSWVPAANGKTAILYVSQMQHMPQAALLRLVLPMMLSALMTWRGAWSKPPKEEFRQIVSSLNREGWVGRLLYTQQAGEWAPDLPFGSFYVPRSISEIEASASPRVSHAPRSMSHSEDALEVAAAIMGGPYAEMTKQTELKELFRAAAQASRPSGNVPRSSAGDRLYEVAQAMLEARQAGGGAGGGSISSRTTLGCTLTKTGRALQHTPRTIVGDFSPMHSSRGATSRTMSPLTLPIAASCGRGPPPLRPRSSSDVGPGGLSGSSPHASSRMMLSGASPRLPVPRTGRSPAPDPFAMRGHSLSQSTPTSERLAKSRATSPNFGSLSADYYPPPLMSEPPPRTISSLARTTLVR